ncbi:FtsH protease activity modulator HflK [Falsirhodobacter halotolerans]|uniref:FtsH protease activity modulator HflK n=1 Tax=Falsirhodobacter halotolerans TaxID=1146892 RepID=UPI001FD462CC|nr:FtsH protease activity modulator HflK [Falsirhodobacter halotolerans]MCJ8138883.1 FtsH protease activity modulator HflK [Falsirhodobacter halotolerans]
MANGGPWGGGGGGGRDPQDGRNEGNRGDNRGGPPPGGNGGPDFDDMVRKGQERLRVIMGGRGGRTGGPAGPAGQGGSIPPKYIVLGGLVAAALMWSVASIYTVRPEQRSVQLFLGEFSTIGQPGLNFAPWPLVTHEIVEVTGERSTEIGLGQAGQNDTGLMLTQDQNIVDIGFQIVWNVADPAAFLFNLENPNETIRAVAESAMRDIIARSNLAPILNRDRGAIANQLLGAVQGTLDSYNAGINVIRVNFDRADPPEEVIDSFREVQAAQQERQRLENEAGAYRNRVTAGARGEAARVLEAAEAYRAQAVNTAQGEASRFNSIYDQYVTAPDVTRERMYLETMERVLGGMNTTILDGVTGEGGVVPYLPLNELGARPAPQSGGAN